MSTTRWRRVIGIVGGLGPHSHLLLETELLRAVPDATCDQDYPDWVVVSRARTPDRTTALVEGGPSPLPDLVAALESLRGRADFAVIACNTAHAWLGEARGEVDLPILDLVGETLEVAAALGAGRVGLLATTGTLASGVYTSAARRASVELVSLPDLEDGDRLQEELVMRPIYGRRNGARPSGGLKAGLLADPESGEPYREPLGRAVELLRDAGAGVVILGCTELPLALGGGPLGGVELIDPLAVAAGAALEIAAGRRDLP